MQILYKRFTKCNIVHWIIQKNPAFKNYPYLMMNQKLALYDIEKMFRTAKDLPQNIDYFPEFEDQRQECLAQFGRLTQFSQSLSSVITHIFGCCQVCKDILKFCPVC